MSWSINMYDFQLTLNKNEATHFRDRSCIPFIVYSKLTHFRDLAIVGGREKYSFREEEYL